MAYYSRREFLESALKLTGLSLAVVALPTITDGDVFANPKPVAPALAADPTWPDSAVQLLNLGGQTVFQVYGPGGGLVLSYIAYLVTVRNSQGYVYPVEMEAANWEDDSSTVNEAVTRYVQMRLPELVADFERQIQAGTATRASLHGGDLGRAKPGDLGYLRLSEAK